MELSERKLKILLAIINSYMITGEPVSSKCLCDILNFSLSPATLRNEMAELTELGFLEQPHTSSGRVPSCSGYRVYIDKLMARRTIPKGHRQRIKDSLFSYDGSPELLLREAAGLLADITNLAVVSTGLSLECDTVRIIQLVQTGNFMAILLLVTSSSIVRDRAIRFECELTSQTVCKLCEALNKSCIGVPISSVTPAFIQTLAEELSEFSMFVAPVLSNLVVLTRDASRSDVLLNGHANLLMFPEITPGIAVELMNFLGRRENVQNLLPCRNNTETEIFIGPENRHKELNNSSVIVTKYGASGKPLGCIGIIGPIRMDYGNSIANLEFIADCVGHILENILDLGG